MHQMLFSLQYFSKKLHEVFWLEHLAPSDRVPNALVEKENTLRFKRSSDKQKRNDPGDRIGDSGVCMREDKLMFLMSRHTAGSYHEYCNPHENDVPWQEDFVYSHCREINS